MHPVVVVPIASVQPVVDCSCDGCVIRQRDHTCFKPLLRRAGLPDIRFHDLRRTCLTLLLTKGVHPKIVSEMLGHSSVSITLDIYSHVLPNMGNYTARAMEEALS